MKYLVGIFIVVIVFAMACTKSHEVKITNEKNNTSTDLDGWFKAGSKPESYEIGKSNGKYNDKPVYFIKSIEKVTNGFGAIMKGISPGEYAGKRVRLSCYIKTEIMNDYAGMWMRVDGANQNNMLAFDNMYDRPIREQTIGPNMK